MALTPASHRAPCPITGPLARPSANAAGRPRQRVVARSQAAASGGSGGSSGRLVLEPQQRSKLDQRSDSDFYSMPRFVHHLDANFRAQLTQLYHERIPEGAAVLDLCSSWVSHLPNERRYARVVGQGMNAAELARNPRLDEWFVRDLNKEPSGWAAADGSFDAVLCVAGLQYLQQPEAVLAEVRRVLKPGGIVIIAFSNRMFYDKAIAAWRDNSDWGRCSLVKTYLAAAGGFSEAEVVKRVELPPGGAAAAAAGGPLERLQAWAEQLLGGGGGRDPFYAVVARKL
ncbi:S-adenosyl-L-methionine-dependent [Chlorella sorokiniana]|uniref:S-adenosyl-L-methionine-dependent n=1 Tax=Chlorella sorokiniana TaxID=3076 RepID=A0A2P6U0Z6_CHLSO|nr:S-adenosyl-L-methionine-dependent [Chlorella sorokiniana]|eukprot:PRW59968.1 S-adenosyl-L-methionine-dependent [Chlorella sorokiniana]